MQNLERQGQTQRKEAVRATSCAGLRLHNLDDKPALRLICPLPGIGLHPWSSWMIRCANDAVRVLSDDNHAKPRYSLPRSEFTAGVARDNQYHTTLLTKTCMEA